jgi:hypothetical protein
MKNFEMGLETSWNILKPSNETPKPLPVPVSRTSFGEQIRAIRELAAHSDFDFLPAHGWRSSMDLKITMCIQLVYSVYHE